MAQAEALDNAEIAGMIGPIQILQELTPPIDHGNQTAARVHVLGMHLHVLRQFLDSFGQNRDLHGRRARITAVNGVFLDDSGFGCFIHFDQ